MGMRRMLAVAAQSISSVAPTLRPSGPTEPGVARCFVPAATLAGRIWENDVVIAHPVGFSDKGVRVRDAIVCRRRWPA